MTTSSSNVGEKLKESFSRGTESRSGLKAVSAKAKAVSTGVFLVLAGFWMFLSFIPAMKEEVKNISTSATTKEAPSVPIHSEVLQKNKRSRMLALPSNLCFIDWAENDPDGTTYITWVRGLQDATWYTKQEFKRLRTSGEIKYKSAWASFEGVRKGTTVFYKFEAIEDVEDCK